MALSSSDPTPSGISVADAYTAIRHWYQSNVSNVPDDNPDYARGATSLIQFLPPASTLSDVEQRAVLREIILGYLEWAYRESNGQYKMAAYAHEAFQVHGGSYLLTQEDNESLKASQLYPYLSNHVKR
jgi:hypothetical protein